MPSNSILVQKQQLVADLAEQIKNSAAGVVVNYQGITVENDTAMRKALREAGVKYVVMKNTMTGRACEMNNLDEMKPYLNGMTALAIAGEDAMLMGGGQLYHTLLDRCSKVYLTLVDAAVEADTFFPNLDALDNWSIESRSEWLEENGQRFCYIDYVNRNI